MKTVTLARPDDWHLHLRDAEAMRSVLPDSARRFARALVMPNLQPPVTTTELALEYRQRIVSALPPGQAFRPLMTLYLTDGTPPAEIAAARSSGVVLAVKLYPAGATTHSAAGVTDLALCRATLEEMQKQGLPLLVHGEVTDPQVDVFDRERVFVDRAPHPRNAKEASSGCAGIYTAHAAIELYAEAFDSVGALDRLEAFAAFHGADFYGLPRNQEALCLVNESRDVPAEIPFGPQTLVPFRAGGHVEWTLAQ
jgi:dihydroorotase